jgi:hypothetical protein
MSLFLLSHLFSVITYKPLLNDLCELIFNVNDEQIIEQMCIKNRQVSGEDYLSEPVSLVHSLSSLNTKINERSSSLKISKTRSRSTPHFSTIVTEEQSNNEVKSSTRNGNSFFTKSF